MRWGWNGAAARHTAGLGPGLRPMACTPAPPGVARSCIACLFKFGLTPGRDKLELAQVAPMGMLSGSLCKAHSSCRGQIKVSMRLCRKLQAPTRTGQPPYSMLIWVEGASVRRDPSLETHLLQRSNSHSTHLCRCVLLVRACPCVRACVRACV